MIKKEYPDIKKDKLGREIIMWDPEKDILTTSAETFLTGNDTAASGAFFHWAYSLNTSMGLYRRSEEKTITVKEDIGGCEKMGLKNPRIHSPSFFFLFLYRAPEKRAYFPLPHNNDAFSTYAASWCLICLLWNL